MVAVALVLTLGAAGCSSTGRTPTLSAPEGGTVATKPVAIVGGEPITWEQIRPSMSEAMGRQAIDEFALDRELRRELAAAGHQLADADTQRERDLLAQTMGTSSDTAVRSLREERGLGPTRFAAVLWRSAALRWLTARESALQPEEVAREIELRFGPAWRARIIIVKTASEAQHAIEQLNAASDRADAFATLARERSVDASAREGGLKPRLSAVDPTLPVALRQWLANAKAGEPSGIIALDRGYALVLPEEQLAPRTPTEEERSRMTAALGLAKQRLAMDKLAKSLLERARVTVMDQSIGWRTADQGR